MQSQYLVVIEVWGPDGPRQTVLHQFTYEVTHLRQGENQWSLVSEEDFPERADSRQKATSLLRK